MFVSLDPGRNKDEDENLYGNENEIGLESSWIQKDEH